MNRPRLTDRGTYDPAELWDYLVEAERQKKSPYEVAAALNVSVDRIIYATGLGRYLFKRKADLYRRARMA